MKRIESRFWHMLEFNSKRIASFSDWQRGAGSAFGLFEHMIHPVEGLATIITDPNDIDGFPLSVVDYGNGKYGAIDEELTRRIPLTLEDIIRYALNLGDFRHLLGQVLEFETVPDVIPPDSRAPMRFGMYRIKPGVEFPVYLILAPENYLLANRLMALLASEKHSFFLLTATRATWSQEIQQLIHDRKSQIVSLEECLLVDNGCFAKSETWDNAVSEFRSLHYPENLVKAPPPYEFRKIGHGWMVRFAGGEMILKDGKGPLYTALLLSKPNEMIFASDLLAVAEGKDPTKAPAVGNAGTISDSETLQDIEKEFLSLRVDLERARADGDTLVEQEVLGEMEKLEEYARKATDGRGKHRKTNDDSDAHRQSVFRAIDRTIDDISKVIPDCGTYLRNRIHTGTELFYEPDGKVDWSL